MAIVAVIMSVNFAACSDDDDEDNNGNNGNNPLVGTWIDSYGEGDYFIWKFNADGTGIEQEYMGHRTKRILRIERKEYQTY